MSYFQIVNLIKVVNTVKGEHFDHNGSKKEKNRPKQRKRTLCENFNKPNLNAPFNNLGSCEINKNVSNIKILTGKRMLY